LKLNPRRLNSLFGAGQSAERTDEPELARRYYTDLTAMTTADAARPEVAHARAFLASGKRSAAR